MISIKSSKMLKYQKAKVKLLEYEVPEQQWPEFPLKYRDLAYPTVLTISSYAEKVNDNLDRRATYEELRYCSDFYDAALQSREQEVHDVEFALSGATAYFFMDNFGSAKVLWKTIKDHDIENEFQLCLYELFSLAFTGQTSRGFENIIIQAMISFWKNSDIEILERSINEYRNRIYDLDSPQAWFWGEIVCAVTNIMKETSARVLLPLYSGIDKALWEQYFERKSSIKLLWPSQKLVCSSKILEGEDSILQLPTGVGKTKSIEIIIWSLFLSGRGSKALIVAPLRSLCNEITSDMRRAFPKEVSINQFSDILENDFLSILLGKKEKQILVCTPEKLQYIFHHDRNYIDEIDLFIFDEGHMFDDRSRGALYELLLIDIKLRIKENKQIILMSAVLPNANQIAEWMFGDGNALAYNPDIRSTPKAIGFTDKKHQVHYYLSAEEKEDYFVPYTYNTQKLKKIGKERKERFFPENAQDIALYYANILCKAGGVAIYFNQKRSIPKFFKRIEDLTEHEYTFAKLTETADMEELLKFKNLYKAYYGEENIYTKTVGFGILPHYSSLPNGIKISTEYAFKRNKVKAVACTSTLAQGVNIPIKYLLITGANTSGTQMTVRNFQNLIGRTGRSGVYTEGDIIVTSKKLYDERKQKGRGYYNWKNTRKLFDVTAVEACGSSILNLVKDFNISYTETLAGSAIVQCICENIQEDWTKELIKLLIEKIEKIDSELNLNALKQDWSIHIGEYAETIDSIENEMIYILSCHPLMENKDMLTKVSDNLLSNSLAFFLASENEKRLLEQIFNAIKNNVNAKINEIQKYNGVMVSTRNADLIIEWIYDTKINTVRRTPKELLPLIEELFVLIYPELHIKNGLALSWIRGDSYDEIAKVYGLKFNDVEKMCQYNISYQMCFLVGNIVDLIDSKCVNLDGLLLIQQALRYGVNSKTMISICEKIFNDRFLAKKIARLINDQGISIEEITPMIKAKRNEILIMLKEYPSYFESVINDI